MKITVLTLFPEMFEGVLNNSIIKRAISKGCAEIEIVQIRDFTTDKYGRTDTPPIGGGAGLIQKCQPIVDALKKVSGPNSHKVLFSPRGTTYNEKIAKSYAKLEHLVLVHINDIIAVILLQRHLLTIKDKGIGVWCHILPSQPVRPLIIHTALRDQLLIKHLHRLRLHKVTLHRRQLRSSTTNLADNLLIVSLSKTT